MSLFGESTDDQRDYRMGLAGLLAGVHALRILAERGPATVDDVYTAVQGIRAVLDQMPEGALRSGEREQLDSMLFKLVDAARDRQLKENDG